MSTSLRDIIEEFPVLKRQICSIFNTINNVSNTIIYITSNYVLPNSNTFAGELTIKNVSGVQLTISTLAGDTLEGVNNIIIYPDESFTISLYAPNDYRII